MQSGPGPGLLLDDQLLSCTGSRGIALLLPILMSSFCPHTNSIFSPFSLYCGDSICHTIAVGTDGRYLVVLVEVVGLAKLGLGVLMVV